MLLPENYSAFLAHILAATDVLFTADSVTQSIAQWWADGAHSAVSQAVNSLELGAVHSATTGRSSITNAEIKIALAAGSEMQAHQIPLADIAFYIDNPNPFPLNNTDYVSAFEGMLADYPDTLAAFQTVKRKPGTLAQAWLNDPTANISVADLDALRAIAL